MQVLYPRISPKKEWTTYVFKFGAEFFIGSQTFCASLNDMSVVSPDDYSHTGFLLHRIFF